MKPSHRIATTASLVLAAALGWILAAPDTVFPIHAQVDSPRSNTSTQPVDVMNWLIDENGNLKVSNQIRGVVHDLLDAPIVPVETWESEVFEVGWANMIVLEFTTSRRTTSDSCGVEYRISPSTQWRGSSLSVQAHEETGFSRDITGMEAKVRCSSPGGETEFTDIKVYLRAE